MVLASITLKFNPRTLTQAFKHDSWAIRAVITARAAGHRYNSKARCHHLILGPHAQFDLCTAVGHPLCVRLLLNPLPPPPTRLSANICQQLKPLGLSIDSSVSIGRNLMFERGADLHSGCATARLKLGAYPTAAHVLHLSLLPLGVIALLDTK